MIYAVLWNNSWSVWELSIDPLEGHLLSPIGNQRGVRSCHHRQIVSISNLLPMARQEPSRWNRLNVQEIQWKDETLDCHEKWRDWQRRGCKGTLWVRKRSEEQSSEKYLDMWGNEEISLQWVLEWRGDPDNIKCLCEWKRQMGEGRVLGGKYVL